MAQSKGAGSSADKNQSKGGNELSTAFSQPWTNGFQHQMSLESLKNQREQLVARPNTWQNNQPAANSRIEDFRLSLGEVNVHTRIDTDRCGGETKIARLGQRLSNM
eukprot:6185255-Amphidinium_carterae.1